MTLTNKQKKKIYMRIFRRYKTLAKKLGKSWKKVKINDMLFPEAYEKELKKEELQSSNLRPIRKIERWIGQKVRKKDELDFLSHSSDAPLGHSEKCQCEKCSGGYGDLTDSELTGIGNLHESPKPKEKIIIPDTRSKEEKEFARRVDENPETQQTIAYLKWIKKKIEEDQNEE